MFETASRIAGIGALAAWAVLPAADTSLAQGLQRDMPVGVGPSSSAQPSTAPPPAVSPPAQRPAAPQRPPVNSGGRTAGTGGPEFRDPKTGQIWTPDNVGQDNKGGPVAPEDRAFDPSGQAVANGVIVDQHPRAEPLGTVPITAGPTVPLVVLTNMLLRAVPGDHWLVTVDLTNNSANTYVPIFVCNFDNGSKPVSRVRAIAPTTGPGERMRLTVVGPATSLYVDKARCDLTTP